jgi:hypothetical protein
VDECGSAGEDDGAARLEASATDKAQDHRALVLRVPRPPAREAEGGASTLPHHIKLLVSVSVISQVR